MNVGEPGESAREVLRFVSPFSELYLLNGRVLRAGGLRLPIENLQGALPDIWKIRLGQGRLEFPSDEESLLHRLGVGAPLASYWGQVRYRYSITPR